MALAATDPVIFEEVQLLADCFAPVFATEIPSAAETLIGRGLLRVFTVREVRTCFLFAITEEGRFYVERWIEQHGQAVQHSGHTARLGGIATPAALMKPYCDKISFSLAKTLRRLKRGTERVTQCA